MTGIVSSPRFSAIYGLYEDKYVWLPYTHVGRRNKPFFRPGPFQNHDTQKFVHRLSKQAREGNVPFAHLTVNLGTKRGYSVMPLHLIHTQEDALTLSSKQASLQETMTDLERLQLDLRATAKAAWKARYTQVCYESRTSGITGWFNRTFNTREYNAMRQQIEQLSRENKRQTFKENALKHQQQILLKTFETEVLPVIHNAINHLKGVVELSTLKTHINAGTFDVSAGSDLSPKPDKMTWHWFGYPNNQGWLKLESPKT